MLLFARPALTLWLGARVAEQILPLFRLFIFAYCFMAFSPAPYHVLNGIGKPWVNTVGSVLSGIINISMIATFAIKGLKLIDFGWSFVTACVVVSVSYQVFVELVVWRRWLHPSSPLSGLLAVESGFRL
jgi:O-antigen/teichoic acid export membrane protein